MCKSCAMNYCSECPDCAVTETIVCQVCTEIIKMPCGKHQREYLETSWREMCEQRRKTKMSNADCAKN